jgi:hypothetical protein
MMTCQLSAQISDVESPTADLQCQWTEILYHNTHTHQTLLAPGCQLALSRTVAREGCSGHGGSGDTFAWGWQLRVMDTQGLATTQEARVSMVPDTAAPSVPTGITATASATQVTLSWSPSTDTGGCGVAGYRVYRDNKELAPTTSTSYSDTTVAPNKRYRYRLSAHDNAGNSSARSGQIQVKTPGL